MTRRRILGVDPGLHNTGWGVIEADGPALHFIATGVLTTQPGAPLAQRLLALHEGLRDIIAQHRPDEAAIEESFVNKNARSSLTLGQARGALSRHLSAAGFASGGICRKAGEKKRRRHRRGG